MAKILVAEDDEELRLSVVRLLQQDKHEVDAAERGDEAMDLLLHYSYDAAILDWDLPGTPGIEICRQYRAQGGVVPILFLTGKSDPKSRVTGLDSGADDYLCKPFDTNEFLARVRALLRRTPEKVLSVLKVGAIAYHPSSKVVYFNDKPIEVSKKEIGLVEFFLRHPNQVFSVEAIVERVWSSNSEVSPETVRPYVKRLREKLTNEKGECQLVTVHGSGYKLVDLT
ncbi:MAG: response regulator transcription factor [Candidatus Obscuribacterales bacterium]|nr:response regulator transcription factor [Candidatus Obscuribacterales bacterium]